MRKMNLQLFAEPARPKNTITPELNYETEAFLDIAPETETPDWVSMANIMKNMSQSMNEVLYQSSYYADKGYGSTEVTGSQFTVTITGDCKHGDKVADYLLSDKVLYGLGSARKTFLKLERGDKVVIWPVTLANITPAYGDSNQPNSLTVTIHGNGRPTISTTTPPIS